MTEDSDLIALGVPTLIYRLGGWNGSNGANRQQRFFPPGNDDEDDDGDDHRRLLGTMLCRSDLGSSRGIDLRDFTDGMLVVMFVAAGCDYCESLRGIGIVKARDVVRRAFHGQEDADGNYRRRGPSSHRGDDHDDEGDVLPVLRVVLDELFRSCHKVARERLLPLDDPETEVARSAYERAFLAALAAFRHPLVYDPISRSHVVANDVCDDVDGGGGGGTVAPSFPASPLFVRDERILMEYGPYRDLVTNRDALYRAIGSPLPPGLARDVAEGRVDPRRLPPREEYDGGIDDAPGSATTRGVRDAAAAKLGCDRSDDDDDEDDEGAGSGEFTQDGGSGLQLSTQESQRSARSSSGMMSSSLSPDLLASLSPQEQS